MLTADRRALFSKQSVICGLSCATIAVMAALIHQSWSTTTHPRRGGGHAERILEGFDGILQVDEYQGYVQGPSCPKSWSHLLPSLARGPTESFLKFVGQKMGQWDN
jgi:hypothetical protein